MITPWDRFGAVVRESIRSAVSQPIASIVSAIIVAGMCATVLLTAGRTAGSEQQVLGTIDAAGARTIVVHADPTAGIDNRVLTRVRGITGIEWAGAFGPALDTHNSLIPGGAAVAVRQMWSYQLAKAGLHPLTASDDAVASSSALAQLGMTSPVGGLTAANGSTYAIVDAFVPPDYLESLQPMIVVPHTESSATTAAPISVLVVVARSPDLVAPVAKAVQSVLAPVDPTKVQLSTSADLVTLRALIHNQLGASSTGLVGIVLAISALLVGVILYGLVVLRRRDFGRRRALGANRSLIVTLLVLQTSIVATLGAILGCFVSLADLLVTHEPLPSAAFFVAVGVLSVFAALIAAIVPAVIASRRDPVKELRVP